MLYRYIVRYIYIQVTTKNAVFSKVAFLRTINKFFLFLCSPQIVFKKLNKKIFARHVGIKNLDSLPMGSNEESKEIQ